MDVAAWQQDLRWYLAGEPWSWIPLLLLVASYPARLRLTGTEFATGLILASWLLASLYCLGGLQESFGTASSENPSWFADNTSAYRRLILIPTLIKQLGLTLPFLFLHPLRLPKSESRLVVIFIILASLDLVLLSTLPHSLFAEIL